MNDSLRVGPYELVQRLGVGGMAETFVALRRGPAGFEQRVCVKRVLPDLATDEGFVRLFVDEARLAGRLSHSNIVRALDFGEEAGCYYMALELVEGSDLRAMLAERRREGRRGLSDPEADLVARELARALDYAHRLAIDGAPVGVIHRDVSPANVLVSEAGEVKLTDFGIAKATIHYHVTRTGVVKGKLPYMSPEQARGDALDPRSDLFSLGVLLHEALEGDRPFDGANDALTLANILEGRRRSRRRISSLDPVLDRLLAPDPADRFDAAADLLDALGPPVATEAARRSLQDLARAARSARRDRGSLLPLAGRPDGSAPGAVEAATRAGRAGGRDASRADGRDRPSNPAPTRADVGRRRGAEPAGPSEVPATRADRRRGRSDAPRRVEAPAEARISGYGLERWTPPSGRTRAAGPATEERLAAYLQRGHIGALREAADDLADGPEDERGARRGLRIALLFQHGLLTWMARWIDVARLRPDSGDTRRLLALLGQGEGGEARVASAEQEPSLRQARALLASLRRDGCPYRTPFAFGRAYGVAARQTADLADLAERATGSTAWRDPQAPADVEDGPGAPGAPTPGSRPRLAPREPEHLLSTGLSAPADAMAEELPLPRDSASRAAALLLRRGGPRPGGGAYREAMELWPVLDFPAEGAVALAREGIDRAARGAPPLARIWTSCERDVVQLAARVVEGAAEKATIMSRLHKSPMLREAARRRQPGASRWARLEDYALGCLASDPMLAQAVRRGLDLDLEETDLRVAQALAHDGAGPPLAARGALLAHARLAWRS
ncbi:MAG: protein kinase [Sandaracinaceae bacterium]